MEPTLRTAKVLKQEAEDLGFEGKEILDYVKEQQMLDTEERAEWRKIRMAELQAEDKKSADEIHIAERADEIKIQIAQIEAAKEQAKLEAEKELKIKEMELQAQQAQAQATDGPASDYDKLKKALLTRYNYTEDGYRKRFREATPETEETAEQFVIRLKNYLANYRTLMP